MFAQTVKPPNARRITLGNRTYVVRPLKLRRAQQLNFALIALLQDVGVIATHFAVFAEHMKNKFDAPASHHEFVKNLDQLADAIDAFLRDVGKFYSVAIPGLDPRIFGEFAEEESSPDLDQLLDALDAILQVNRLTSWQRILKQPITSPHPLDLPMQSISTWRH